MESFSDHSLAPFTFSLGFVEAPLAAVSAAFVAWKSAHFRHVSADAVSCDLRAALARLEPMSTPPRRFLLWATDSPWVAYFDNGVRGPDPFSPVGFLSETLRCRGVIATCVPDRKVGRARGGTYGAVAFQLFGPRPTEFLNRERWVSAANDGGTWRFDAEGIVQPFEETERYASQRIADRLTPDVLARYCRAVGIRPDDPSFLRGPGTRIEITDPPGKVSREMSWQDARSQLSL